MTKNNRIELHVRPHNLPAVKYYSMVFNIGQIVSISRNANGMGNLTRLALSSGEIYDCNAVPENVLALIDSLD